MDEILITGNLVSLRSVSETRKISTDEFYESLALAVGTMTPILPPAVIFHAAREGCNIYATHHLPQTRKVKVKCDREITEFTINLPHMYWFHKYQYSAFESLFVFGAKAPANALDDKLYLLPLKNLYDDGRVCLGDELKFSLEGRLSGKIARVESYFWSSVFNSDLDFNYESSAPANWSGDPLTCWQLLSEDDAFDPCEVDWMQANSWHNLVKQLLER